MTRSLALILYRAFVRQSEDGSLIDQSAVTATARADLTAIHSHIAKDKPEAASHFMKRLRATARQLAVTPGMGRNRGEDLRPDIFSFPVGSYVLFYRKQPDGIVLVRVLHGSRDVPALL